MTEYISKISTLVIDLLLVPFGKTDHTLGLVWLSILTGVGMAYVFKYTSNQEKIRAAKDRFKSYILEMRLYQDDLGSILSAFFGALAANLRYLSHTLKPLFVLIIPVVIIFMQLDERYARSHLLPGSTTILSVRLADGSELSDVNFSLQCGPGVSVDAGPVRINQLREINWRLRVDSPGIHTITLSLDGTPYNIPLVAEQSHRFIGASRNSSSFIEALLHPGLTPIPSDSPLEAISLYYPGASYRFLYWYLHWIVIFIIYSLIGAVAVKLGAGFEI